MLAQQQIALQFAKGEWQKAIIREGFASLKGRARFYYKSYKESLKRLKKRLQKQGIPVYVFVHDYANFYLVIGEPWVRLVTKAERLRDEVDKLYSKYVVRLTMDSELREVVRHSHLSFRFSEIRSATYFLPLDVCDLYCDWLESGGSEEFLEKATKMVEEADEKFNAFIRETGVGLLLLD